MQRSKRRLYETGGEDRNENTQEDNRHKANHGPRLDSHVKSDKSSAQSAQNPVHAIKKSCSQGLQDSDLAVGVLGKEPVLEKRVQGMRIVGLTGSIACGKSAVCRLLQLSDPEAEVVDLDSLAHELLAPGASATRLVAARFPEVMTADGSVDRVRLGERIFANVADRRWLNSVTHWRIAVLLARRLLLCWLRGLRTVVLDAPLLFETGLHRVCFTAIVCVAAAPEVQLDRLMKRDGISEVQALRKINAQMSSRDKERRSEFVIDNSSSLESSRLQTARIVAAIKPRWGLSRWWLLVAVLAIVADVAKKWAN